VLFSFLIFTAEKCQPYLTVGR